MPKVHILKPEIVSKIAAGEVVERPASVIKELVENALDARADTIEVRIKDAGRTFIRVKDNGRGIERGDLETIFQRHATSKIATADDLYAIRSLGFRGEALYSVAAVSHVTLHSKTPEQDIGWGIHLRGGENFHVRPCSFNGHGTEITVKELFFNTPARRKFLKSDTAEVHQILNTLIPYALLHNEARFSLIHGEKSLLDAAPAPGRIKRIAAVLNLDERHLLEVRQDFPGQGLSVHLLLGDMNIKRARRDMQFIFVNNRPVENKAVGFHMNRVYRLIMPPELYPCFAVYLTVPAQDVDANIHPAKREVKIKNERDICAVLRSLCERTLMTSGQVKQVAGHRTQDTRHMEDTVGRALMKAHPSESAFDGGVPAETQETTAGDYAYPRGGWNHQDAPGRERQAFFVAEDSLFARKQENLQSRLKQAGYVGRLMNKFLLFEMDRSMLVIDQHAAAERITYEQLIRQMDKGDIEVQHLLSPVLIKLTPQEILVWEEAKEKLEELGISGSQWDAETLAIHTHPLFLRDIEKAVRHLLAGEDLARCDHHAMARRACRASVMAGDRMAPEQAEHIRAQLIECLDPFTCPHGRPTVVEMSEDFLDKQFLRT